MKFLFSLSAAILALAPALRAVPPTLNPDAYSFDEDTILRVSPAIGVLSNDAANGNAPMQSLAVTNAQHGRLVLDWDGGFKFYPDANYFGPDSFSYYARKALIFTLATNKSTATLAATVQIGVPADTRLRPNPQTRTTTAKLGGPLVGNLTPRTTGTPTNFQTVDFDIENLASNKLLFGFTNYPFWPLTAGASEIVRIEINVPPAGVLLSLDEPGLPATVSGAGKFDQTNLQTSLDIKGRSTTKINDPLNPPPVTTDAAINLGGVIIPLNSTNASIASDGTTMTLKMPFYTSITNITYGNDPVTLIDVSITGIIEATAAAIDNTAEPSGQTLVSLTVNPVDDLPVAFPDGYVTLQAAPLVFGSSAPTNADSLILPGATWSYLYTTNTGIIGNWTNWAYNDSSWKTGAATLGFGPSNIITDIRGGGPSNIATAYFRRNFFVDDLSDSLLNVLLSLKRDDAAAVYINGAQVYRDANLASNATHATFAGNPPITGALENTFIDIPLGTAALFDGWNVLAAEVHKLSASDTDLRFDCGLVRGTGAAGVLNNDYDIDTPASNLVSIILVPPQHGTLNLNADGSFNYTPNSGFSGVDSFAYRVLDRAEPASVPQTLVPTNAIWLTWTTGTDPNADTNWFSPALADTNWPIGLTEIGYGDEADGRPEVTNIRPDTNSPVFAAYFFRKKFFSGIDTLFVTNITGRVLRDDAAAVYFNGVQVYRDANLASNATYQTFATAQTPSETNFAQFSIPPALLLQGTNTVAIEVHQVTNTLSEDLSFDFALIASVYAGEHVTVNVLADDLDNDLVSDTYERRYGYDFSNPADAPLDDDRDGRTTRIEFITDTNPRDPSSFLHASSIGVSGTDTILTFAGISPDRVYQLQWSTNVTDWADTGDPIDGSSLGGSLNVPLVPGEPRRFYRLKVLFQFP